MLTVVPGSDQPHSQDATPGNTAERKPRYPSNQRRRKRYSKNRQRRASGEPDRHKVEGEDIYSERPATTPDKE
jgi:hypothetical protein